MTSRPTAGRALQLGLVAVGIALFAALIRGVGVDRLAGDLRGFGVAIAGVVGFELVIDACNTLAWRAILRPGAAASFWLLFWVRQAGVAINQLTPTATVGGEVVKATILRPRVPMSTTAASLVATRMSYALGQAVLVLLGLSAVLARMGTTPDLAGAVVFAFVTTLGGILAFVWLQRRGIFATLSGNLRRLGIATRFVARLENAATTLDANLADIYRDRPGAFALSLLWHVVGQLIGLAQLAFILAALGIPTPIATCLAIEAFALVLDSAAFLVPGRIGVQEAGRVLVFTTFGFEAATGLAVAVIVRLNQLAVAALGLVAFATLTVRPPAPR